jgi:heme oxygenase (staphylobilin-producing)
MIAIFNSLPVKEGDADEIVDRFAEGRGHVQGFHSMEVLKSDAEDEVLVVTRWRDRESFEAWVQSDASFRVHGRSGEGELLRGHPRMTSYRVAVERAPEASGPS